MTTFNAQILKTPEGMQAWDREKAQAWQAINYTGKIDFGSHAVRQILEHDPELSLTPERVKEAMVFYTFKQRSLQVMSTGNDWFAQQAKLLRSGSSLHPGAYID
jgi:hypothetical protein